MSVDFDISSLEAYRDQLIKFKGQIDDILLEAIYEIVQREYRMVVKNTPVDSGCLREGWIIKDIQITDFGVEALIKNEPLIKNDEGYASFVESGHRTRDHKNWVPGVFMLKIAEDKIKNMMDRIVERHLEEAFRKL